MSCKRLFFLKFQCIQFIQIILINKLMLDSFHFSTKGSAFSGLKDKLTEHHLQLILI